MAKRQPTPIPPWAHAVEDIGGVWRCSAIIQRGVDRGDFEHCTFTTTDPAEAIAHATSNQFDATSAAPVDVKAA